MRFHSNFLKRICVLASVSVTLLLAGCAHKPQSVQTHFSQAELRAHYVKQLQQQGVQTIKVGETMRLILPSDRLFYPATASLTSHYKPELKTIVKLLNTYSTIRVKVAAYTTPGKMVQALTTKQAQVIVDYLWSHGADTRLMYAAGYGATHTVASNATPKGRAANQRVEISFRFYPPAVVN